MISADLKCSILLVYGCIAASLDVMLAASIENRVTVGVRFLFVRRGRKWLLGKAHAIDSSGSEVREIICLWMNILVFGHDACDCC